MTDIEKYEDPARAGSSIELAPKAWTLAQRIAATEFVPKGLRGKPEAVMAAMLYGREAGVGEMQALSKIHVVDGRPGMAAELMRALVFQHGHELWIEESSSTRCIVAGKRRDSTRETRVTWTLDDGKRAGLLGKDNWKKYPDAMLLARATAKLCRAVFPDVLAGLSYTLEELADGDTPEDAMLEVVAEQGDGAPAAPARPKARARKTATRGSDAPAKTEPDPVDQDRGEVPDLPDPDDEITDAEIVEDEPEEAPAAAEPDLEPPEAPDDVVDAEIVDEPDEYEGPDQDLRGPSYTGPQVVAIRLGELGVKDRARKLEVCAAILDLDEDLESTKDLTAEQITAVLEGLEGAELVASLIPEAATVATGAGEDHAGGDASPAPETSTGPRRRRTPTVDPEEWDADRWRAFLKDRAVKVSELVKEANRLGREAGTPVGSLDEVPGSGLCATLVGFVEDLALERGGAS